MIKKILSAFSIAGSSLLLLGVLFLTANFALAQDKLEINFFYSETCPHCAKEKEFLKGLTEKYPQIELKQYEVISNTENQKLLADFYEKYDVPNSDRGWVPVTFTPTKYFIGFNEQTGKDIENCIEVCMNGDKTDSQKITVPFLGEIDASKFSLPVLTVILAALDGFNPCAMWVLLFLITLLINVRSKKRLLLIGGSFIVTSGIVYFLILSAWLNLFMAISYVNMTRILIGVFAIAAGIWQLRAFKNFRPGVCKVTDGKTGIQNRIKNSLTSRAQKLAVSPLNLGILAGIILLALGVNLVEFFCSAGLPSLFTRILALNDLNTFSYYFYLFLYTFIFMLDDLIIFTVAIFTLKRFGFSDKYNRWSTLIGGLLILILGILLIFKPEILMFT